jgi:hypothetical protein
VLKEDKDLEEFMTCVEGGQGLRGVFQGGLKN